ncbi:hypothetical protein STSP2_02876 [Anaerohalosphaera lusitana]|uniref:Dockerin domain-containing protein n=1 Tax=Anaerohalosphaera lusitana TaxID=1936003 RepID=A0A1U9NP37_9BACT|nr:GC-type dockerin domain-anchored protein [Anaerohalosphaera lusitana]AQT69681.1 hypothetical protein STSP2_02876 [Anaerohalosphaera lusitana]
MRRHFFIAAIFAFSLFAIAAWTPLAVKDDPLVRMPGTQPGDGVDLEGPGRCLNCHADYDPAVEPGFNWSGSMMAQSARDPIFYACFTVAMQDSIWALGNPNAGDLCMRCHFPEGWVEGRSDPVNASMMAGTDFNGIHCDFCHTMYDPFFETTFAGLREGSDWIGYWDEAGNTGPGSGTLSQTMALETYQADALEASGVTTLSGDAFYDKFNQPIYPTYAENASGQFFVSAGGEKRASFADAGAKHSMLYSRYHKSKYMCATCHDVSNPALANLGLSGLADQSGGAHEISEQYSASSYFHVERTFSEFMLSAYGRGGAATNAEFAQLTAGVGFAGKCQDCHMRDGIGYGCDKNGVPLRPSESTEHPNSGMPVHDLTGGNSWISYILASLDESGPVYDARNAEILGKGPDVLTLDLSAGESPVNNGAKLKAGSDRALDQLGLAATIKGVSYDPVSGALGFRVQNNTGHKLISGFPEGRRMFVNIRAYRGEELLYEVNPYDYSVGTLKGLAKSNSSPALGEGEAYSDVLVYEVHPSSDLTGEDETFHFVLATGRYKDNRIPPKGFDISAAGERLSRPVWHGVVDEGYFTAKEYAGGYDQVDMHIAKWADKVEVSVYYQGTSREYVEFLRDEINGSDTLSSPSPSGTGDAYVIQTDPFFAKLRAWGDTIWDLWYHNHGLDGSGAAVPGIVPYEMASAEVSVGVVVPGDFEPDGDVDADDFAVVADQWLTAGPEADMTLDGVVDYSDFAIFAGYWLGQ